MGAADHAPFAPEGPSRRGGHQLGLRVLLDWLAGQPGRTWQDRWLASGANAAEVLAAGIHRWLRDHGHQSEHRQEALSRAVVVAISADLIRPSLNWLVTANFRKGSLVGALTQSRDAEGFTRLQALCSANPNVSMAAAGRTVYRTALIVAAKGGMLSEVTTGDVLELLEAEADAPALLSAPRPFYRALPAMGISVPQPRRHCASCAASGSEPQTN